jgi:hypothetical protein
MVEREFKHLIGMAINSKYAVKGLFGKTELKNQYIEQGKWAVAYLEKKFRDTDHNVRRWLSGEKCICRNPKTNAPVEVEIGFDIEAIYRFLTYCLMRKVGEDVDSDFFDYLVLSVTRSNSKVWEEC